MAKFYKHHQLNQHTFDNLLEGFQLICFDWKYLYVNKAVVKQSKYSSKNDLLGFTMMEKYPGIENTPLFKALEKCMKQRISKVCENKFTFPDHSTGWFELRIEPVPEGLFILSLDITERKKIETEKKAYMKSIEKMLYMTSHEVRQPVANCLGLMNVLEVSDPTKEDLKKIIHHVFNSAKRLEAFTEKLTGFIQETKAKYEKKNWAKLK